MQTEKKKKKHGRQLTQKTVEPPMNEKMKTDFLESLHLAVGMTIIFSCLVRRPCCSCI